MSLLFTAVGFWFIAVVHSVSGVSRCCPQRPVLARGSFAHAQAHISRTAAHARDHLLTRARIFPRHLPGATPNRRLFSMISPFEIGDFACDEGSFAQARARENRPSFGSRARENRPIFARIFRISELFWGFSELFSPEFFARFFSRTHSSQARFFARPSTRGDPSEAIIFDEFSI